MIERVVSWSARSPWVVIVSTLFLAIGGHFSWKALARDVVPDLSDPQIGVVVEWPGHSAPDVAGAVTRVLVSTLEGVAGAKSVRGSSMAGMAYVDLVFDTNRDIDEARRSVVARVAQSASNLPPDVQTRVGPPASSTGWVFEYALFDPSQATSLEKLNELEDDIFRPALTAIPGVAEVASVGGGAQQVAVSVNEERLAENGVAFTDVIASLRSALSGADASGRNPAYGRLCAHCDREIEAVPIRGASDGKGPLLLRDVASARMLDDVPMGYADYGGIPAVGGIVIARRDADLDKLVNGVRRAIDRERRRLPRQVRLVTVYDRLELITRVHATLGTAIAEEVVVVVLVILVFLLHPRSALVPLVTLPAVLLLTFAGMWLFRVPANIMSLGGIGIALGLAVDADVVALEACHRQLEGLGDSAAWMSNEARRATIRDASERFAPAIVTSLIIAALSFLPVLAFTGEAGRLLSPLALTKTLVIASAALVALTLAPALRDRLLCGRIVPEFQSPLTRGLVTLYRPFVHFSLARPAFTLTTAALIVFSCLPIVTRLGSEFLPRVDEGDLLFMPTTRPGVPPAQAAEQLAVQDRALAQFPEVATAFGKVGRADTATDPAPYSMVETTIRLRPRSDTVGGNAGEPYAAWLPRFVRPWIARFLPNPRAPTNVDVVRRLDQAVRLPGWTNAWTAPARARMDMMSTGVRTPLGIRVVSPDLGRLDSLAAALRTIVSGVPGTRSVTSESLGGESRLRFDADAALEARFGVDPTVASEAAELWANGGQIGGFIRHGMQVPVRVQLDANGAADPVDQLGLWTMHGSTGARSSDRNDRLVSLALLGRGGYADVPSVVRSEGDESVAYVYIDLKEGADIRGYVESANRAIEEALETYGLVLKPGERLGWVGQYDLLVSAERRLRWVVPLVVIAIITMLVLQFRNLTEALLVAASVPFALVGSIWALFVSGYPLSAPVWVGILSVFGLAMQTGVVMVVYIDDAFYSRVRRGLMRTRADVVDAHAEGTVMRLRPKLMTTATMAASLTPLLWADGAGSEIMRRVATPMLGGLLTSAFLTLEVLPVLYTMWRARQLSTATRMGVPIEALVGTRPAWARRKS